jgi:hypothetical protein
MDYFWQAKFNPDLIPQDSGICVTEMQEKQRT